jgi:serine/threonine protein phosphatase PrpC
MSPRASIVAATVTHVGNVRDHNEDAAFVDEQAGVFLVCDGMGGHAAGEVASAIAIQVVREKWTSPVVTRAATAWAETGTADAKRALLAALRDGAHAAHAAISAEAEADTQKRGMGTTFVGVLVVGADAVLVHAGDSRAYLVREGIAMQLTEDHTLLAKLLAAGIDVDVNGDGARFKTMLTNALGIGAEPHASTFLISLHDGDRLLLCSDGVTEYVAEAEVGEVLTQAATPGGAAQQLIDMSLARGGHDNATAVVLEIVEVGAHKRVPDPLKKDAAAVAACPLYARLSPQKRLRGLRIAIGRELPAGEVVPAHTLGDRVAWVVLDGEVERDGVASGAGALLYPESLIPDRPMVARDNLYRTKTEVRGLVLRSDDFQELCADDLELAEPILEGLAGAIGAQAAAAASASKLPRAAPAPAEPPSGTGTTSEGVPSETE